MLKKESLHEFVESSMKKGYTESQLKQTLKKGGYSASKIKELFAKPDRDTQEYTGMPLHYKAISIAAVIIFVIIISLIM